MRKKALVTGITGQDGSYLAELLLEKGYEVHGIRRPASTNNLTNLKYLEVNPHITDNRFHLHYGDLTDSSNLNQLISSIKPQEIYNLGAQSHVHTSFQIPEYTADVDALGVIRLLDAIKENDPSIKYYQASTSELFGKISESPQTEKTPFNPQSPYAIAKLYAFWISKNFRDAYQMYTCNGILFNHESPRRGLGFVTRKITSGVANILNKQQKTLFMGNLDAKRDWGYAKDYVHAMWLMLQQETPDDYVIATGENHTVREFIEKSFAYVDVEVEWRGEGVEEEGVDRKTGVVLVKIDPYYFRPTEVDELLGDPARAKDELGWETRTSFDELVEIMMKADLDTYSS